MKPRICLAMTIVAGAACAASANPEKITLTGQRTISMDRVGHIYYNAATGEMVQIPPTDSRGTPDPLWINEKNDQCNFGEQFWFPAVDTGAAENDWWLDWGDIANESFVDTMTIMWVTDVPDPELDGVDGLEADFSVFDGIDQTNTVSGFSSSLSYLLTIANLPGSDGNGMTGGANLIWLITVDLSGGNEITFGSTDTDGDGNADFAYGWQFRVPSSATDNLAGMMLVVPPEGVFPNALGDSDGMGLSFDQNWATVNPNFWFGGYDCTGGPGFAWSPWGSYYLGLYGPGGGEPGPCSLADTALPYGELNFGDVQTFLGWFSGGDLRADIAPAGAPDGVLNFGDVQLFLGLFSAGCP